MRIFLPITLRSLIILSEMIFFPLLFTEKGDFFTFFFYSKKNFLFNFAG